jgi:hypothetical protein
MRVQPYARILNYADGRCILSARLIWKSASKMCYSPGRRRMLRTPVAPLGSPRLAALRFLCIGGSHYPPLVPAPRDDALECDQLPVDAADEPADDELRAPVLSFD